MPKTRLTDALETLAAELERRGVNVARMEIVLPLDDWRVVARTLDEEHPDQVATGASDIGSIEIGGIRVLVRFGG